MTSEYRASPTRFFSKYSCCFILCGAEPPTAIPGGQNLPYARGGVTSFWLRLFYGGRFPALTRNRATSVLISLASNGASQRFWTSLFMLISNNSSSGLFHSNWLRSMRSLHVIARDTDALNETFSLWGQLCTPNLQTVRITAENIYES